MLVSFPPAQMLSSKRSVFANSSCNCMESRPFRMKLMKSRCRQRCRKLSTCISSVENLEDEGGNSNRDNGTILVAGAGIAGLAAASALHQAILKVGIPVRVLERDNGPRLEGSAIGLWPNAFRALDALGVAEPLREAHPLLQRIELCTPKGEVLRNFSLSECDGAPHEFRGVVRSNLLRALESSLPPNTVQYSSPIAAVRDHSEGAALEMEDGRNMHGLAVVGADGSRSQVAAALSLSPPNYAGYSAYRGVAEFSGPLPLPKDTVRQIVGRGVRAGMYPLSDTSLYWFIAMSCPAEPSPRKEDFQEDALKLVKGWGDGMLDAIQQTPADAITRNRITDRWLLPFKAFGKGHITVAGDAAHPMTPNLGQGGCTALEDAVVLAQELKLFMKKGESGQSLTSAAVVEAFRRYEKRRALRVAKITIRSNFIGQILGSDLAPVCAARNAIIKNALPVKSFMGHTRYDCGTLQ